MIRRPPRSTLSSSSAASDVYKRQVDAVSSARSARRSKTPRRVMELHACYFKDLGAFSTDQRRASATAGKPEPGRLVSAIGLLIPQCRPGRTTKTPRLQGNLSRRSRSYGHSMGVNTPARKSALGAVGPRDRVVVRDE